METRHEVANGFNAKRADSVRSAEEILIAAERTWSADPRASLAQIADVAGVNRTTVYRRFNSRAHLIEALAATVQARFATILDQVESRGLDREGLVDLAERTLRVKADWRFTLHVAASGAGIAVPDEHILSRLTTLFSGAQSAGLIDSSMRTDWVLGVYLGLLHEAEAHMKRTGATAAESAELLAHTLLSGLKQS
ncbi:TetR/AcrR family transcriptional regulator [Actinoplanes sp. NPDC049265]|uniref:TetR/AcrR family transcriptional regulator n=1 Tax=Actinoplanes sp. NPDC049265 TaxID=3363902 RepID=UPI003716BEAA